MEAKSSLIITIFFPIFYCLASLVFASSNTLLPGDVIDFSISLVSESGIFSLGFFSPQNSRKWYLGIWYTDDSAHPIWVGNRNTPIHDRSGVLIIDPSGTMIIKHSGGDPIELHVGQIGTNSTANATLSDFGNFILYFSTGSVEKVVWESFDHPTDTLLPGMKLGVNHRTGRNWSLTSWLADGVPASGDFTLDWDPRGRQLIVRRRGVIYWTSGALHYKGFEFTGNFRDYYFYNVTNDDEESISYSSVFDSRETKWVLDQQGCISDSFCMARVDLCYGFNTRGSDGSGDEVGCELWEQPKCRNRGQKFDLKKGDLNHNDYQQIGNSSLGDCRANCWNDCDCIGFGIDGDTDCIIWTGKEMFYQDYIHSEHIIYVLTPQPSNMKWKKLIWIVTAVVIALLTLLVGLFCYLRKKIAPQGENGTRKENDVLELMTCDEYADIEEHEGDGNTGHDLKVFSYASITAATSNFSSENKLGEGGFGPVYKGKVPAGQEIAVKKLSRKSGQGLLEFKNELTLIAKVQHMNLVRLLGCCIHGNDKMLIYEYMPNRSLDFFLFDPIKGEQLTWERRFNIIEGITQGLLYLHKYSRLRIVHRDLKASNILLDENMNPKISDFGMAKIFKHNATEANTNRIVGTYGYMAPEYAMEGIFSAKSDVFSFGVLMLEIVSGQKNNSFYHVEGTLNLVGHAWELWNRDAALELTDPILSGSCNTHQLLRCIHVGLLCVEDCTLDRPTISDVISMLTNDTMVLPMPKKPAFVTRSSVVEEGLQSNKSEKYSVNGLSFSTTYAR